MKNIKTFENYNNPDDNLGGFERAVNEILNDKELTQRICDLIPPGVILPLYFKGDIAKYMGNDITITDVRWKNGGYIYYFYNQEEDGEYYIYERDLD